MDITADSASDLGAKVGVFKHCERLRASFDLAGQPVSVRIRAVLDAASRDRAELAE